MEDQRISIVVTSIFSPNESLLALAEGARRMGWEFIIVGDVASPDDFHLEGASYYDIAAQKKLGFKFSALCPERHYTRKNIGYLLAISNGSNIIIETDDDNIPNPAFWQQRHEFNDSYRASGAGWCNVYKLFTDKDIWPRGFPLEKVLGMDKITISEVSERGYAPIQQGLADQNPDVDAVYRMTRQLPFTFEKSGNFQLSSGVWCPFNSQNTTWFKGVFPLLYLPSFCSFRMTDIWRSFVAQRILWQCGWSVLFHGATVWQDRNQHNLLKDFEQEVSGYVNNDKIRETLDNLRLTNGIEEIPNNMMRCYEALVKLNVISDVRELDLLAAWLHDIKQFAS